MNSDCGQLRARAAHDEAIETWLRTEVAAAYDELRADPPMAISSDEMRAHLAELHQQQSAEIRVRKQNPM